MISDSTRIFRKICNRSVRQEPTIEADKIASVKEKLMAELPPGSHYGKWFENNIIVEPSSEGQQLTMRAINKQLRLENAIEAHSDIAEDVSNHIMNCVPNGKTYKT